MPELAGVKCTTRPACGGEYDVYKLGCKDREFGGVTWRECDRPPFRLPKYLRADRNFVQEKNEKTAIKPEQVVAQNLDVIWVTEGMMHVVTEESVHSHGSNMWRLHHHKLVTEGL